MLKTTFVLLSAASLASAADSPPRRVLTMVEAMKLALVASPDLRATAHREVQEEQSTGILEASLYPTLDFQALTSEGFPNSNGGIVSGLMGSAYRSGPAMGFVSRWTPFDLTRLYGLEDSKLRQQATHFRSDVHRMRVSQEALQAYLEASRFRGHAAAWETVSDEAQKVIKIVDNFVRGGQHSIVSQMLIHDQLEDAEMRGAEFEERYHAALGRLAALTGLHAEEIECPLPTDIDGKNLEALQAGSRSPLVARAEAEAEAAHAEVSTHEAENYPKILAIGSVGMMSAARLVKKQEYSLGLALTVPVFEGLRITHETQRAKAKALERDSEVGVTKLALTTTNLRYDEAIAAAKARLRYLDHEAEMARASLKVGLQRYVDFVGTLVDVREALRNLARVETSKNDARVELLLATGSKALLNGAVVP